MRYAFICAALGLLSAFFGWRDYHPPLSTLVEDVAVLSAERQLGGGLVEYSFATQSGARVRRTCGGRGGVCQPEVFKKQLASAKRVLVWHDQVEVFQVQADDRVVLEIKRFNSARWFPQLVALMCALGFVFNMGLHYGFINRILPDQRAMDYFK